MLQKYGGLVWVDPDHGNPFMASRDNMHWCPVHGPHSYCVKVLLDTYDPTAPDDDDWVPWVLDPKCFLGLIVEYYAKNPTSNVTIVKRKIDNNDVNEESSEDVN